MHNLPVLIYVISYMMVIGGIFYLRKRHADSRIMQFIQKYGAVLIVICLVNISFGVRFALIALTELFVFFMMIVLFLILMARKSNK
ncbi:hypothetical protein [Lactiplantibacillus daowaiensis]|uniref:Integral membrane protein n=1 Tax=Lactiplantibacillus daowaiensis TaxID=2559918 RepID=A0ABW1S3Y3_9LACO|nr:hypothetical protein [Lactiplantibacillus daowaiensis]